MRTNLLKAVENVYDVFKKYDLDLDRIRNNSCSCCVNEEEIRTIAAKPLRQLSEEDLGHFLRSAISTFGSIEDYKHFLPRILELICLDKSCSLAVDFVDFEKLNYAEWETWPITEISAIEKTFIELWKYVIHNPDVTEYQITDAFSLLCIYGDVQNTFLEWSSSTSEPALLFILEGVINGYGFGKTELEKKTISEWLYSEKVLKKLENKFFATEDKELANRISIVHTILENKYPITFN